MPDRVKKTNPVTSRAGTFCDLLRFGAYLSLSQLGWPRDRSAALTRSGPGVFGRSQSRIRPSKVEIAARCRRSRDAPVVSPPAWRRFGASIYVKRSIDTSGPVAFDVNDAALREAFSFWAFGG